MNKVISRDQVLGMLKDEQSLMVGGFLANGTPDALIDIIHKSDLKGLTIICNDTGFPERGVGILVVDKKVKKVIASHIGTNPETGRQMNSGDTEVVLVPQGTLAEQIRAGGAGLGGVLTATGLGTVVADGKPIIEVDGKEYLLEKPLRGDVALLKACKADKLGNLIFNKTAHNFNSVMALAADLVIAEVEELVEIGQLEPDAINIPGVLVHYLVMSERGE